MKKYTSMFATLLLTAGAMTSANAQTNGENYAEISAHNGAGWTIATFYNGNSFHSCGATTSDIESGMDDIILEYTGSDWQIGRNEGSGANYQGRIFVGPVQDTLSFEPAGTDVYSMVAPLQRSVVAELKREASFIVEWRFGDRFTYSLSGSSAAMAKTEECFRNQGSKIARRNSLAPRTQPRTQFVQPAVRRQNNNQNNSPNREQRYASVRGWQIDAVFVNNGFNYCAGSKGVNSFGGQMRIAHGSGKWGIGMKTSRVGNSYGELIVDYSNGGRFSAGSVPYRNDGDGWAATQLNREFVRHLKSGLDVWLDIGTGTRVSFRLSGSTAAMLKMEECARNQGRKPIRRVAQPRRQNVQPALRRQVTQAPRQQFNANNFRKSVLSGTWIWDDPVKNSQQNAIVSTIEIIGANSARYCYGIPCWDVTLNDGPNNTIHFSHDGVALFEFWETGPNQISANFWEDRQYSTNSPPSAYVNMR